MNEQDLQQRVLTLVNYVVDDDYSKVENKTRVTIQPNKIAFVIAGYELMMISGEELYRTNVFFDDATTLELFLRPIDLATLQTAVGTYFTSY